MTLHPRQGLRLDENAVEGVTGAKAEAETTISAIATAKAAPRAWLVCATITKNFEEPLYFFFEERLKKTKKSRPPATAVAGWIFNLL
jgi:hypothetical protein